MSDPALALQAAEVTALKATGGVGTGARVYDKVPTPVTFPYVRVGDHQVVGDDSDCEDLSQVYSRVHVWSQATGWPEAKAIAASVRDRIRSAPPAPAGFTIDNVEFVQALYLEDPDGLSRHAVVEFRYLITHT